MTNEKRILTDCLMKRGLEGIRFKYDGQRHFPSYEYTVESVGRGRDGPSLWIKTPSEVETRSQEKRVSLYEHLYDEVIE